MPRLSNGPRLWYDEKRDTWHIRDVGWKSGIVSRSKEEGKSEAERHLREHILNVDHPKNIKIKPESIVMSQSTSIEDVLISYFRYKSDLVKSRQTLTLNIENLLIFFSEMSVSHLNAECYKNYQRWRAEPREDSNGIVRAAGASSVRRELGVLKASLAFAKEEGMIAFAPIVRLPPENRPADAYLERVDVAKLLRATRTKKGRNSRSVTLGANHLARYILIAFYTGRRKEAILSLSWDQIRLSDGYIDFRQGGVEQSKKKRGWIFSPRKLLLHLERWSRDGASYVVHIDGKRLKDIKKGFAATSRRAGIEGITPHTLKHTAVTLAAIRQVSPRTASDFFATSEETLKRVYEKHPPEQLRRITEDMDREGPDKRSRAAVARRVIRQK